MTEETYQKILSDIRNMTDEDYEKMLREAREMDKDRERQFGANSSNPWHTGTPTEEGWYLCYYRVYPSGNLIPTVEELCSLNRKEKEKWFRDVCEMWVTIDIPSVREEK